MTRSTFFLGAALTAALIFSVWLIRQGATTNSNSAHNAADTPDSFMVNATYIRMNQDGKLHNKIFVSRMVHFLKNDVSNFTNPKVIVYNKAQAPWNITAAQGQSRSGIAEVQLWNNVKIHQPASKNNHEMTITTSKLTIFPEQQSAMTDQAITIAQPGEIVNAVGLKADLEKGEVELLSKAKAIYK